MKKILLSLFTALSAFVLVSAQDNSGAVLMQQTNPQPRFNGGPASGFVKWVNSQIVYPREAAEQGISGKVTLRIIILSDGSVSDIRVVKSAHPLLDAEAVRVVSSSPKWEAGMQNGTPVDVAYSFPITFRADLAASEEDDAIPFQLVDQKPSFNGGDANEFAKWVNSRLVYPEKAKEKGIQGRVVLQFVIETDGSITDIKVLKSDDPLLEKEAIRVVSSSPKWQPGMRQGKPVRVTYTYPVVFGLINPKRS